MSSPITKEQVQEKVDNRVFPTFVIDAFNECISESKIKKSDVVKQKDVINKILSLAPKGTTQQKVIDEHWLDVEKHYERAGWKVSYFSPDRGDSFDAYFEFK